MKEQIKRDRIDQMHDNVGSFIPQPAHVPQVDMNFKTPEWTNQAVRTPQDQDGFNRNMKDLSEDSSESAHNKKDKVVSYQCDKVWAIQINLNIDTDDGLSIICMHHKERTSRFA